MKCPECDITLKPRSTACMCGWSKSSKGYQLPQFCQRTDCENDADIHIYSKRDQHESRLNDRKSGRLQPIASRCWRCYNLEQGLGPAKPKQVKTVLVNGVQVRAPEDWPQTFQPVVYANSRIRPKGQETPSE